MPAKRREVWKRKSRRQRRNYPISLSSIFDPVVEQNTCSKQDNKNDKKMNEDMKNDEQQPGPSVSAANAPAAPPVGKGKKSSVSEFCVTAASVDLADDFSGLSTIVREVENMSLEDGATGSEKSAPVQIPGFEQEFKLFTDFLLDHNRFAAEFVKKIQEKEKSSVSECCAPAASGGDLADDCSGLSTFSRELKKMKLENCATGSVKNAPAVKFLKTFLGFDQECKAFTDFVLENNRYTTELIKKIRENTEVVLQMKIKILRSLRTLVALMENFPHQFEEFDVKDDPAVKEEVSPEVSAKTKKACREFFALLGEYREISIRYTQLNKAASDAQEKFKHEWHTTVHKVAKESFGFCEEGYRVWSQKKPESAKKYETMVLFNGENKVREIVTSSQDGFKALIEQHKKEIIAAENFYEAIDKVLYGNPIILNAGRMLEIKLYEMEKKFKAQTEIKIQSQEVLDLDKGLKKSQEARFHELMGKIGKTTKLTDAKFKELIALLECICKPTGAVSE